MSLWGSLTSPTAEDLGPKAPPTRIAALQDAICYTCHYFESVKDQGIKDTSRNTNQAAF